MKIHKFLEASVIFYKNLDESRRLHKIPNLEASRRLLNKRELTK